MMVGPGTDSPSEARNAGAAAGTQEDDISLWDVLAVLLLRRRIIVRAVLLVAFLAILTTLARDRTWTTTTYFRPQGSSGASQLVSLASQFGVNVGGGDEGETPAFYQGLLATREVLSRVASESYRVNGQSVPLATLLEIEGETPELRLQRVIEWLRERAVSVSVGRETGTVTVDVRTRWPELSQAIGQSLLDEVSRFNLETRQSQARAERGFIEERLEVAEQDLRDAEAALQEFLQNNRAFGEFSQARLEADRLGRDVLNRQQVYNTLLQSYEQARISEVRDTPVITVLQSPYLPPKPDGRGLTLRLALGVVLGGMLGVVLAFTLEVLQAPMEDGDPARRNFQEALAGLLAAFPFRRAN
ncbi:MAG: hypothetical protein JSU98_10995 [Gemmatimonadales bacterium]|nr:MAG: hypothetical protein JSU98_10995 [Gemmatimonadales bacterium]